MKKLRLGEFERNSLVVFAITMIANVLSYLYQIVMGNVLTPADYGTVNTLLSLSVVVGVPSGIISALTATYTAKYHAHGETFAIAAFMHGMLRVAAVLAAKALRRRVRRRRSGVAGVLGAYRKAVDSVNEGCTWLYGKEE